MEYQDQHLATRLLEAVRAGDRDALNNFFPIVYEELRAQARSHRRNWNGDFTLNTTAMVHEAYLKIVDQSSVNWQNRAHFLAVASRAMRFILLDYAKQRKAKKRGGAVKKISFDDIPVAGGIEIPDEKADALIALDQALTQLEQLSERQSKVVECRFFGGMTIADTASALEISTATVKRDWLIAQAWLYRQINAE